jgi:hypothetical protein
VRVHLDPAHQLLAMEQVDHAVVREVRDQRLGHVPQGQAELKRAGQPFPDPLQQADLVTFTLAAAPAGLAGDDHDAVDGSRRMAQRHRLGADEHPGTVTPDGREGPIPGPAAQHVPGQLRGLAGVAIETERKDGLADQPRRIPREVKKRDRERIGVQEIAEPVGDNYGRGYLP